VVKGCRKQCEVMADVTVNIKSDISDVEKDVIKLSRELRDAKLAMKDLDKSTQEYSKRKAQVDQLSSALIQQKDALQDLRIEAKKTTNGFVEAKEKMSALKDEAITLQGSGVERLEASFGLLREGFTTADSDKIKTGFQGIGNAMKAIPIFLLIELIKDWDELSERFKEFFGIATAGEKQIEALNEEMNKTKEINKSLTVSMENEIKLMEAQGASQDKILAKRKELNALKIRELEIDVELQKAKIKEIFLNDTITESVTRQTIALQRKLGNDEAADILEKALFNDKIARSKEQTDAIRTDLISIANLKSEIVVEEAKIDTEQRKKAKEISDQRKKDLEDSQKLFDQAWAEEKQKQDNRTESELKDLHELKAQREKSTRELQDLQIKANQEVAAAYQAADDLKKKLHEEDLKRQEEAMYKTIDAAKSVAEVFMQLDQTKFNEQKNTIERQLQNEALTNEERYALQIDLYNKERELKRKQFDINKAFNVVAAIQDGIRSVSGALANTGTLGPGAIALAAVNATIAAANVAKILATKFDGGVAPAFKPNAVSTGGAGGNGNPSQQQLPQNQASNPQGTNFDSQGNKIEQRVYVLEEDITDTQNRIARVAEQRKF